jgi:hypothetical protein
LAPRGSIKKARFGHRLRLWNFPKIFLVYRVETYYGGVKALTIKAWRNWPTFGALGLIGGALLLAACSGQTTKQSGSTDSGAQNDAAAPAAPAGDNALPEPKVQDRKIVRNANLDLRVDNVVTAVQQIDDVAAGAGGFVSASSVLVNSGNEGGDRASRTQTATLTIRVPAEAYSTVMSRLRGIAKETVSETSNASEVTEEFTDLQARQRNLQATEQRYLELLNKAASIDEILTVQDRLNGVRLEIEQVTGRINVLNNLTGFASITVQLSLPPAVAQSDGKNWAQKAWQASWETSKDAMVVFGTLAIVGSVLLAWLAVPATILLVLWRLLGRRIADFARRLEGGGQTAAKTD